MSDEAKRSFADLTKYLSVLSAYSVGISVLYLWGYWGVFDIKILEYLSLSDVVKAAALPMLWVVVGATLGALLGEAMFGPGGSAHGTTTWKPNLSARSARLLRWLLLGLYSLIVVVLLLWDFLGRWQLLSLWIGLPIFYAVGKHGILMEFIPNDSARAAIVVISLLVPASMYERGLRAGSDVAEGREFDYLVSQATAVPALTPLTQPRFLGHAGDVYFIWNPVTRALTLTKLDSKAPLEVIHWRAAGVTSAASNERAPASSASSAVPPASHPVSSAARRAVSSAV
jgi:hypothetical protein